MQLAVHQVEASMLTAGVLAGKTWDSQRIYSDCVVLANALDMPRMAAFAGVPVPLTAKPRTITVITKPMKPILQHIVVNGKLL